MLALATKQQQTTYGGFMLSEETRPRDGTDSSYCYLTNFSSQDKPWDTHRRSAEVVEGLYRQAGFGRYADRMQQCSEWLLFALTMADEGLLRLKLHSAHFCRVRHCPICQWRKSLLWRSRFLRAVPRLLGDNPGIQFVFLTLTVRNCHVSELKSTLADMNAAWRRLTQRRTFPALGFVKSVEVTRGADRNKQGQVINWREDAHPHFHCLLAVRSSYFNRHYINQQQWREMWQTSLGVDYLPVVHVKKVRSRVSTTEPDNRQSGIIIGLCETLKYSVKVEELTSDRYWLEQLTTQLHKTRTVAVGGIFKNYMSEDEPENLVNVDEENEVDVSADDYGTILFDWSTVVKRYAMRRDEEPDSPS